MVTNVMREVGSDMRSDSVFGTKILDDLEIAGVEKWADSAVTLRCRFQLAPIEQPNVLGEFPRRMKAAFDIAGTEMPFLHLKRLAGQAMDGSAPSLSIKLETVNGIPANAQAKPGKEAV